MLAMKELSILSSSFIYLLNPFIIIKCLKCNFHHRKLSNTIHNLGCIKKSHCGEYVHDIY